MVRTPTKARQKVAASRQNLAVTVQPGGLDVGYAATKLVLHQKETVIPSYIQPLHTALHQIPVHGYVRYSAGPARGLTGKAWLSGLAAYQYDPEAYLSTFDDRRQGKIALALQLLLGALSYLPHQERWNLYLSVSIHHAREMGDALKQALEGTHSVYFNENNEYSHVSITVLKVLDEGAGAVAMAGLTSGQNLVYDFGGGTVAISIFGDKGRLIERDVLPGGVNNLINAMAKNPATIKRLGAKADRETIRRGLENGSLAYGLQQPWDMTAVYEAELRAWVGSVLRTALKTGEKWQLNSQQVIAIGGGTQLPKMAQLLRSRGITPLPDGSWVNARGLQRVSDLLGAG